MNPGQQIQVLLQEVLKHLGVGDFHLRVTAVGQKEWESETASTPSIVHIQTGQDDIEMLEETLVTDLIFNIQLRAATPDEVSMMEEVARRLFRAHPVSVDVLSSTSGDSRLDFYWRELVVRISNRPSAEVSLRPVGILWGTDAEVQWGNNSAAAFGGGA